jgi:hypothetical protein
LIRRSRPRDEDGRGECDRIVRSIAFLNVVAGNDNVASTDVAEDHQGSEDSLNR